MPLAPFESPPPTWCPKSSSNNPPIFRHRFEPWKRSTSNDVWPDLSSQNLSGLLKSNRLKSNRLRTRLEQSLNRKELKREAANRRSWLGGRFVRFRILLKTSKFSRRIGSRRRRRSLLKERRGWPLWRRLRVEFQGKIISLNDLFLCLSFRGKTRVPT